MAAMQFVPDIPDREPTPASAVSALNVQELLPGASVLTPRPRGNPSQAWQGQNEVVFHQKICILGRFSVVLSSALFTNEAGMVYLRTTRPLSHSYTAQVFDKGTLFTPSGPYNMLSNLLERPEASFVDALFTKSDTNSVAFEQVKFDLGRGRLFAVQRPGALSDVLCLFHQGAQFFLHTTALSHLQEFVASKSGAPWICQARLRALRAGTQRNEDFEQLMRICKQAPVTSTTTGVLNSPPVQLHRQGY